MEKSAWSMVQGWDLRIKKENTGQKDKQVYVCVWGGAEGCKSHVTETIYQLHNFARSRSAAEIWLSEHFFVFAVWILVL